MLNNENSIGRPSLSEKQVDIIFRKLEPHLKAGLSLHKASIEAQIPKSTVYDLVSNNEEFSEKIQTSMNYFAVLVNSVVNKELVRIAEKQKTKPLNPDELKFIQWTAINSKATRDEFDRKFVSDVDKESEVNKEKNEILNNPQVLKTFMLVADRLRGNLKEQDKYPPAKEIQP